jgi:Cdc6-like AAA superfamily ATPase
MDEPLVLVISGSMGTGKTAVLGEASDLLSARNVVHAAFDLDAMGLLLLPEAQSRELHYRNLAMFYVNCREAGVKRFLFAAAIESREALNDLARATGNPIVTVCRLIASQATMDNRLRTREVGMRQHEFLERSRMLNSILDAANVEDFWIQNDGHNVTAVAEEMLVRANWITVNR